MKSSQSPLAKLYCFGLSAQERSFMAQHYPDILLVEASAAPNQSQPWLLLGSESKASEFSRWSTLNSLIYCLPKAEIQQIWHLQKQGIERFLPLEAAPDQAELIALIKSASPKAGNWTSEESCSLFWTLDKDLKLKHWPPETAARFGLPATGLLGGNFLDLALHPQNSKASKAKWLRLKESFENHSFSYLFRHPDGSKLDYYLKFSFLPEQEQWLVIAQRNLDIKPSALPELRFRKLIEHSHDAVIIAEPDSQMRYLSPSISRILGYSIPEVQGLWALDFLHPDDRPEVEARLLGLIKDRKAIPELRLRVRHQNGHYLWALVNINDRRSVPGVEGLVINLQEVDELFHTREELKNSLERFKWASRATQDVIWEYRVDSGLLDWGENLQEILGPFEEAINTLEDFIQRVEPSQQDSLRSGLQAFPPAPENYWQAQYRFRNAAGQWRYIKDQGYLVRNEEGEVYKVIGAMRDFTVEREYQEEIQKRENRFRGLFEKALIGISQLSSGGRFLSCNAALENILGHRESDITGLALADLIHPEDQERFEQAEVELEHSLNLPPSPLRLRRRDGLYAECIATAFSEKDANASFSWWYLLDISQMQKTTNALEKTQRRLNELVQNASDVLVVLNEESKYEFITANIEKVLGYRPEEMLGHHNLEYVHPDDIPHVQAAFEEAVAHFGSDSRSRFRARHKDGHWVWVEVNGKMQINPEGAAEALLHVRKLENSQKQYLDLLKKARVAEVTNQSIIITDPEERIEWANASFTKLSGFSLKEAQGKKVSELLHGPESKATYQKFIREKLSAGEAFTVETVNYHKKGFPYWIESSVSPVRSAEGEIIGFVALEKDISERRKNFQALEEQLENLNADHSKLRNYSYTLSHNFRSHVSNISTISDELKNQKLKASDRSMLEDMLYQSTQQLQRSLTELNRELDKPGDGGSMDQSLKALDFVERVLAQMQSRIEELGAQIEIDLDPQALVLGRPAYLESIFHNLISNALRYRHPERPPKLRILSTLEKTGELKISLCDNGVGIDLAKNEKELFKFKRSFHQHPDSQGIGLYLVREQLRMMQARVKVESKVNQGSCFHLYFRSPPTE